MLPRIPQRKSPLIFLGTLPLAHGRHAIPIVDALPRSYAFEPASTALVVIDMQHDFLSPGGWADAMGLPLDLLAPAVPVVASLLASFRTGGATIIHTREGHRPDLADCPPAKRGRYAPRIGESGPLGRYMVTGEAGNGIVPALSPIDGEIVIDKPGAGAFYATLLDHLLRLRQITHLVVAGVTTDVCVHTTIREANDRGYECLLVEDATASYDPAFTDAVIAMMRVGVAGFSTTADKVIAAMDGGAGILPWMGAAVTGSAEGSASP
jgi:nicotinamidase-related amidase